MRVAIMAALLVLVAGCGSSDTPPTPQPSTSSTTTTATVPMLEKWEIAMRTASTRDRCATEKAFTTSCVAAMENLDRVSTSLAKNAPTDGTYANAALVAISVSRAAAKWASECVEQAPEVRLQRGCLQALATANGGDEAVIAALHEVKQSR